MASTSPLPAQPAATRAPSPLPAPSTARAPSPLPSSGAAGASASTSPLPVLISTLLTRRQAQLAYLQRAHSGHAVYLNTARLTAHSIPASHSPAALRLRVHRVLLLGLSLGRLVGLTGEPTALLSALAAVLDEWQFYASHYHATDAHYHHATSDHTRHVHAALHSPALSARTAAVQPAAERVGRWTVFSWLLVPALSAQSFAALSLYELTVTLLSVLSQLYSALLCLPASQASWQLLVAVDRKVQSAIMLPLLHDLTHAATDVIKTDLAALRLTALPHHAGGKDAGDSELT